MKYKFRKQAKMLVSVAADYFVNIIEDGKRLVAVMTYKTVKQKNEMLETERKNIRKERDNIIVFIVSEN